MVARPGVRLGDVHDDVMRVLVWGLDDWGLLPVPAEQALRPDDQRHRRYMIHGTSHHLGLDVHDCSHARREAYLDGRLRPGMVFTIEPGLFFQAGDLSVPEDLRGIGVRVKDDYLVTDHGVENLSAGIPRSPHEIEQAIIEASDLRPGPP